MKKLKLLLTAFALLGGVISASAQQTVPVFQELNSFGGTAVSSLTTFVPNGTTYTLELTGCTSGTEITVPGGSFSYTPTTDGIVRFVRFGSTVYVYEGTTYKGTVEVSTPAAPTYPDIFGASDNSSDGTGIYNAANLFLNPGFETKGDKISDHNYKAVNWDCNGYTYGSKSRVRDNTSLSGQEGSCTFFIHGYGNPAECLSQTMTGLNNFTPYKFQVRSWKHETNNAKFGITIGTSAGDGSVYSGEITLPNDNSTKDQTLEFTTGAITGSSYVFALTRKTDVGMGDFDRMTLVAANGGGIGITGAKGATFLSGSAYAPEGVLAAAVAAERYGDATMHITNPTFDSNIDGWNTPIGGGKKADNKQDQTSNFYESWNATPKDGRMYQVIENLPSGTYELEMIAFADQAGTMTSANTTVAVYAQGQDVGTTSSPYIRPNYVNSVNFTSYKAYAFVDGTGKIEIGMRQYSPAEFRWLGMDNVTLKYIATDNQEEAKMLALYQEKWEDAKDACNLLSDEGYTNVKGAERANLTSALSTSVSEIDDYKTYADALKTDSLAFTAGKTNWDLLATEISKATALGASTSAATTTQNAAATTTAGALQAVKDLKVTEYNYVASDYGYAVSLGSWNTTGPTGSKTDQHWSGESREYLEQSSAAYGQESWDIAYDQDLALPAGNYVFKVAGRQANSDKVTLSLTVKIGEDVIGTVADFPKGDNGLGINKSGATSFNSEDVAGFANSNNGRGWEWRYVKFTLASDATVKVSVEAHATAKSMWVSFCDATVQTDNETNLSLIAYNIALGSAQTVIEDGTYSNVTGSEKTDLQAAIGADTSLDKKNKSAIDAATTTLNDAIAAFTGAKSNYDAYVAAKAVVYPTLSYATAAKRTALDDAQSAADATSADDAETKTAAIQTAARQYYESHALAENVTGAENKTNLISDPNFAGVTISGTTAGAWTFDQTGGNVQVTSSESFTDGSDNSSYSYFDYYNGSNNNQNIHQVISGLAPGRYMLTATGRGHSNFNDNLQLYVVGKGDVKIPAIGSTGGVFNRGWNDASLEFYQTEIADVTIGAKTNNSKPQWWSVTRFRLVRLGDAAENVTVSAAGFATYVPSHDLNFSETSIKAYKVKVESQGVAKLTKVDNVPASTPVLLHKEGGATENIPMMTGAEAFADGTNDLMAGTGAAVATTVGDYTNMILNNGVDGIGFYFANNQIVAANRAYLHILTTLAPDDEAASRMVMVFADEATGISTVKDAGSKVDGYYDLQGRRVTQPAKGLYIVNGKKVVIK